MVSQHMSFGSNYFPSHYGIRLEHDCIYSLLLGSITTWEQLLHAFLDKYFSSSKTSYMRSQITTFSHNKRTWLAIHIFYKGLNLSTKLPLDVVASRAFMRKGLDDGYKLIEEIVKNHYLWSAETSNPTNKSM
ncbi:hypothetical protein CR513_31139, partial [Mucuna pruriens]